MSEITAGTYVEAITGELGTVRSVNNGLAVLELDNPRGRKPVIVIGTRLLVPANRAYETAEDAIEAMFS
jgi:hypothetical protein